MIEMKKLFNIIFLTLITLSAFSQPTIEIVLMNNPFHSRGSVIESVVDKYELVIPDVNPKPYKVIMMFDKWGYIINKTEYGKAGGKQSETNWEYNELQKITKKTHRYFVNMMGWRSEETSLTYNDTTNFISEINYRKNGTLLSTSKVFCDSSGKPIEVRVLDEKGIFSTIERLAYSPSVNIIRVAIYKVPNQFFKRWVYPLDASIPYQSGQVERLYYMNGEVMLESLEDESKLDQGYYYEYKYDDQGNWTEKDTYQVSFSKNRKVKEKKLEHKIFRTIKYY